MKKILACLLVLLAVSFKVCAEDAQITLSETQIEHLGIEVDKLNSNEQSHLLYAPATVVAPANRELLISTSQPGLVTKLAVNLGDPINQGQVLAQLNSPELVNLQREFLTASSELELVNQGYQRDQKLFEEGVIPARRWQETQAQQHNATAQLDTVRQLLMMAGMSSADIQHLASHRQLNNVLTIRSPINGVVLERLATLGARLDLQAPLYRIADLSELWLEINIPQERLKSIKIGDTVKLDQHQAVTAKIQLLGQSVDDTNQTIMARAVVSKANSGLRIGQHLTAQIMQHSQEASFAVPNTAIAQYQGHAYVFLRNAEGFAVHEVTVSGHQRDQAQISGNLSGNEQIASKGAAALKAAWLGLGGAE